MEVNQFWYTRNGPGRSLRREVFVIFRANGPIYVVAATRIKMTPTLHRVNRRAMRCAERFWSMAYVLFYPKDR